MFHSVCFSFWVLGANETPIFSPEDDESKSLNPDFQDEVFRPGTKRHHLRPQTRADLDMEGQNGEQSNR
jgi:hypothetical protein